MAKNTLRVIALAAVMWALSGCSGSSSTSTPLGAIAPLPSPPPPPPAPLSTDAALTELSLSDVALDQIFQSTLFDYTAAASNLSSQTRILAMTSDAAATLSVNGVAIVSATPSVAFAMQEGPNVFTVTVTAEDGTTTQTYSIEVDRGTPADLMPVTYIKSSNAGMDDRFGREIALAGDTLAVAADQEDGSAIGVNATPIDDAAANSGAVYVFLRDAAGVWVEQAYVKASNTEPGDEFGHALALDGDTLAVSAYREDSAAVGVNSDESDNSVVDAGAVYVFARNMTGIWSQQAYIKPPNTDAGDAFGTVLDLEDDTLVVGAALEDGGVPGINGDDADNSAPDSGAVYVYVRDNDGVWALQAYLKSSNPDSDDQFGAAVALSGDTLVVGAPNEASRATGIEGNQSSNSWPGTGAAYVFVRDDTGAWSQQAYIKASNTGNGDLFGAAVGIADDTLVVGAPFEDSAGRGVAAFEADNKALNSGAAYVFVRDDSGIWTQDVYVKASNTESQDLFGRSVAILGNTLAVSSRESSAALGTNGDQADNSATRAGAVYLLERDGVGEWSQKAYLKASNTGSFDEFGTDLALESTYLIVSAPLEDSSATGIDGDQGNDDRVDSGAVYVIR